MDSTAFFLAVLIIVFLGVIIYVMLNSQYQPHRVMPHRVIPHRVMPQFGPYWTHGGQANSGLLY
jgi:hypothetical protein